MIDPNSLDQTPLDEIEGQPMDGSEDIGIFYPDSSQIVDIKKTPIVDFIRRNPPKTQPICLIVKQTLQIVKAMWVALDPVHGTQHMLYRCPHDFTAVDQCDEPAFDNLFFSLPFPHLCVIGVLTRRQMGQRCEYAFQFEQMIVTGGNLFFDSR